jgi:hypothetical protein
MGWPTELEIGIAARLELTEEPSDVFKTSYGYNVTTLLERVIADLAATCNRPLGFDQATLTETFDGGRYILHVKNPPIASVTSVTDNDDDTELDIDEAEYWIYEKYVRLPRPVYTTRVAVRDNTPQRYTIIYVGGYDDDGTPLPADLVEVCAEMATRVLLRVDQQYRVYDNVDQFQDGEIKSVFPDKEKAFSDLYTKLARNGRIMRVVR